MAAMNRPELSREGEVDDRFRGPPGCQNAVASDLSHDHVQLW